MKYLLLLFFSINIVISAQNDNDACLTCHSDETLNYSRNGKVISLFVDESVYSNSIHAPFECIDCHTDFSAEDIPHRAGNNIYKVDCSTCHDAGNYSKSVHGTKNLECSSCHGKHNISAVSDLKNAQVTLCIQCHQTGDVKMYLDSKHYQLFRAGRKDLSCTACHGKNSHEIESAAKLKTNQFPVCSTCHANYKSDFSKEIHLNAGKPGFPACSSCHGSHLSAVNRFSRSSQDCLKCHLDPNVTGTHTDKKFKEFIETFKTSVHAKPGKNGFESASCADCHGNHVAEGLEASKNRTARQYIPQTCGKCHTEALKEFNLSSHGQAFVKNPNAGPVCTDCHGEHEISVVDGAHFTKLKIKQMCIDCHVNNPEVVKLMGNKGHNLKDYEKSAHWIALKNGNEKSAVCSDCHTGHSMLPAADPNSSVNKKNIDKTCGTSGCHTKQRNDFTGSVHQVALLNGNLESPTCTDCHGDHQNTDPIKVGTAGVSNQFISKLCSDCHASVELADKYNLPVGATNSYYDSFHGLAVRGGSKYSANCASCHNYHNVRNSKDPLSSIHKNNLSATCGKCHPGANLETQFTQVHLNYTRDESALLWWTKNIYIVLIILTIGAMFVHNLLDFIRKLQERKAHKAHIKQLKKEKKYYLRMTLNERIQHFLLLTTFIGLVISGFGLVYPEAFWVRWIRAILGDDAFELRGITHRVLGVGMILTSLYHVYYLFFTVRGKQLLKDFLPAKHDLKDVVVNIKYLLGISKIKPEFRRFSYMEKAEYWALIWGTVVMSVTGVILMFNNFFLANTSKLLMDFSTVVHLYEAWLATLSIIVWHFYFVIFSPEVYPVNPALVTGYLDEELMKSEHLLEYERMNAENEGIKIVKLENGETTETEPSDDNDDKKDEKKE
ncbi:MAG: cytochrome c3 family protein [Ignavibacteriaceae bacterium]|nr:cytochrome c3 family protein [Ignavibacteriaceae bacterium]